MDIFGNYFLLFLAYQFILTETHTIREACSIGSQRFVWKGQGKSELFVALRV
jgi:hypothetical protein